MRHNLTQKILIFTLLFTIGMGIGTGGFASAQQATNTGVIDGTVTDISGDPIVNATVTVTDDPNTVVTEVQTDSTGEFVTEVDGGAYDISVSATGYYSTTGQVNLDEGQTKTTSFSLRNAITGSITGTVVSEENQALSGADVILQDSETGKTVVKTTTDSEGGYSFVNVVEDEYQIKATFDGKSGFATVTVTEDTKSRDIVITQLAADDDTGVITEEVTADGSRVTIETNGASAISITDIEGDASGLSASGTKTDAGILFSSLGGLPDTVSFELTPPTDVETVTFDVDSETVELDVMDDAGDSRVVTKEVNADGSVVTIETNGVASISLTRIEGEVSNLPADGVQTDAGILFSSLGGLPETVNFSLTPPEDADTVSFDIDGKTVELAVSTDRFADREFNNQQYTAVFDSDGDQTQDELSSATNEWFNSDDGSVNDVSMSQDDLSDLINYWYNK